MVAIKTGLSIFKKKILPFLCAFLILLFLPGIYSMNTEAASDKVAVEVKSRMSVGAVPVIIILKDRSETFPNDNAISSLKSHASSRQQELASLLKEEKSRGKADKIKQFWIVNAIAVEASPELIEKLGKRDDVAGIELDSELQILEFSPQVTQGQIDNATSEIARINATKVWELGIDGSGINVSVIDTGINASHPDITGRIVKWVDFVGSQSSPYDNHGHGTHVAGTVAGNGSGGTTTGVAPNASLLVAKVCNSAGSCSSSNIVSGIEWAVGNNSNIISISLGGSRSSAITTAVNNAINASVTVIAAAGNSGPNNGTISFPAGERNVIAAGAVDSTDTIASFSSRGPITVDGEVLTKPDVSAPGVTITSLDYASSGYVSAGWSGTSMATPHVSGAVALLLHAAQRQGTTLTPAQIKNVLENTSVDLYDSGKDNTSGAGRINVSAAVLSIDTVGPSVVANPTGYAGVNTAAKNGTAVTLNVTITDAISGVKNATVNVSSINTSLTNISLLYDSGFWKNSSVIVNASDGTYYLNVTSYDNLSNINNSIQLSVTVDNAKPLFLNASASPSEIEAGSGNSVLRANITDNTSGVAQVTVNLSEIGGSSSSSMALVNGTSLNGTWQLAVNTTSLGNFTLVVNATDGAGNFENMDILLNTTDTTPPVINSASAAPDSISADGIDSTTLTLNAHDFSNVSSIRNVTVNLSRIGGNSSQEMQNISALWQLTGINTSISGLNGTLLRLPVNVTDSRNNSNTSASILLGIKKTISASAGTAASFNFTIDSTAFNASISIPGATSLSGELLVAPVDFPSLGSLNSAGVALNFSGLTFDKSLWIEIQYNSSSVSGNESKLRLWFYNTTGSRWEITENSSVDTLNRTVSGNASHFTVFAPLADVSPPVISSVASGSVTSSSATITWTTDEASQSLVKYGTTSGSYTSSTNDTSNVTSHSVQLTGLSASTAYYYVVNSTDQSRNSNESSENSFTTSSAGGGGGSSGGGGGGGGGGGASAENASNIFVKEKYDLHIFKDKVTSYRFKNSSNPVLFVNITGNISAGEITTSVEVLKNTSSLVGAHAPGEVYKNINIWVGSSGFAVPRNIKNAEITFRIEKELAVGTIALYHYDSDWVRLPAQKLGEDGAFEYYASSTARFSPFAITRLKEEAAQPATIATPPTAAIPEMTPEATNAAVEKEAFKDILLVTALLLAIITLILAYLLYRRK